MPISSVADARFDHVDEDGELVFVSKGLRFRISVDDTLEHAILEARQILSEADEASNPGLAQTLPISSIQALIRAGAQPEKVAEKYGLSQALVRRFSAAVETEKQYAIEQFLAVSAPKGSKVHSVEELIARTLAAARIGMESVKWGATRRGREPWLITATFSTQRNRIRAEWTWNMHDNTVECQNAAAQILLGERDTTRQPERSDDRAENASAENADSGRSRENTEDMIPSAAQASPQERKNEAMTGSEFAPSRPLPGNSVRSARIASTVASMQERNEGPSQTAKPYATDDLAYQGGRQQDSADDGYVSLPYPAPVLNSQPTSENSPMSDSADMATVPVDALSSLPLPDRTPAAQPQMFTAFGDETQARTGNDRSDTSRNANERQSGKSASESQHHDEHKHSKRRSGRSAVPSWDEILFGE
ncbi:septation protein SepH [Bifidobacterium sp. ESL0690]|uniref:septation protein SepH n=1 Tax=Bifidobacterium sp. ESL0690 TaxID=2983214 RepID=UPI0023F620F5|nr:septation protein SepH [Bifidobacterium sp. ESL0690]WEV46122.1 septation protein SepH [Bifidobacterium sp. ESL0690]